MPATHHIFISVRALTPKLYPSALAACKERVSLGEGTTVVRILATTIPGVKEISQCVFAGLTDRDHTVCDV